MNPLTSPDGAASGALHVGILVGSVSFDAAKWRGRDWKVKRYTAKRRVSVVAPMTPLPRLTDQ